MSWDSTAERITCPICGRPDRALTKSGKIRKHADWEGWSQPCRASGVRPEDIKAEGPR